MSIVVFLNKVDVVGIALLFWIGAWIMLSAGHGILNGDRGRSICFLAGCSILLFTQAATLGAGIMRRVVWHYYGTIWPPLESWQFGAIKILTFIGIMLVFRSLTVEAWGERPWCVMAIVIVVGIVWAILPFGTPAFLNIPASQ